mgnify:CR=1 FL=1
MGCSSCSNDGGVPKGCQSNGSCGTGSCNKLTVFDWLGNMSLPAGQEAFDWVSENLTSSKHTIDRVLNIVWKNYSGEIITNNII